MFTHPASLLAAASAALLSGADGAAPAKTQDKPAAAAKAAGSGAAPPPAAAPSAAAAPATPAAWVDGIVTAYGGKAALDGARALRMTGTVESPTRGKGDLVRSLERPDRLKVDVRYAASREVRLLDGPNAFQNGKPVTGMAAQAMALQAFRLDLPSLLGRLREQVRDLGPTDRDGAALHSLALPLPGELEVVVFVDPSTFRIVRSETSVGPAKERVTFAANYSDFRVVQGVLVAFAEENFAGKMATGVTRFEKIEVLPALPEETWKVEKVAAPEK